MTETAAPGFPPVPLSTDRLVLRHYRADDVDALLAFHREPNVVRWLLDEPWTLAHAEESGGRRRGTSPH